MNASNERIRTASVLIVGREHGVHNTLDAALSGFEFRNMGLSLTHVYSASAAIEIASLTRFSVILVEVSLLTDSNGLDLINEVRRHNIHARIIIHCNDGLDHYGMPIIGRYDISDCLDTATGDILSIQKSIALALISYDEVISMQNRYDELQAHTDSLRSELSAYREFLDSAIQYSSIRDDEGVSIRIRPGSVSNEITLTFDKAPNVSMSVPASRTIKAPFPNDRLASFSLGISNQRVGLDRIAQEVLDSIEAVTDEKMLMNRLIRLREQARHTGISVQSYLDKLPSRTSAKCRKLLERLPSEEDCMHERQANIYLEEVILAGPNDHQKFESYLKMMKSACDQASHIRFDDYLNRLEGDVRSAAILIAASL